MPVAFFTTANTIQRLVKIVILLSLGIEFRNHDSRVIRVRHAIRLLREQLTAVYLIKNFCASGETQDEIRCFTTVRSLNHFDIVPPTQILSLQDQSAIILPSGCKMLSEMTTSARSF